MSMPIFLDNCIYDHMPNGSDNEWKNYSLHPYSREANAFFPLFWLLMFKQEDIKSARFIDDFDIDNVETEIDRQECFDDFGESTFPYFIVAQAQALENLQKRKSVFLNIFGQDLLKIYDHFQEIIQQYYPNYILLRTNGLDLVEKSEQNFRDGLSAFELLEYQHCEQDHKYWENIKADMQKYINLNYYLLGISSSNQFIDKLDYVENPNYVENKAVIKDLPNSIYWVLGILVGVPTVFAWFKTHSVFYALITFIILAAVLSFLVIKYTSRNFHEKYKK